MSIEKPFVISGGCRCTPEPRPEISCDGMKLTRRDTSELVAIEDALEAVRTMEAGPAWPEMKRPLDDLAELLARQLPASVDAPRAIAVLVELRELCRRVSDVRPRSEQFNWDDYKFPF